MVIHTARRHFCDSQSRPRHSQEMPHIVTSSVEHDSVRLLLEQLVKESLAGEWQRDCRGQVENIWLQTGVRKGCCSLWVILAEKDRNLLFAFCQK